MAVPSAAAEVAIKKLARVGGNTICPNCGIEKKFGFGTVCMKYLTFVCNECKSSHQAISHRCKSLTMSSWTDGEIIQIRTVGGNDRARATWLATAPPPGQNGRPAAGSSIDVYKSFIVEVYERKKYYRENTQGQNAEDSIATAAAPVSAPPVTQRQPPRLDATGRVPVPRQSIVQPTPTPPPQLVPPVADLLDFDAFDTVAQTTVAPSASTNLFGEFTASPPPSATAAPAVPIFDPFGSNNSTPATVVTTTSNAPAVDIFGTAATNNPSATSVPAMTNSFGSFDPFSAGSGTINGSSLPMSTAAATATKPPIMNNAAMSGNSNIGMMMGNMNVGNTIGGSIMMNQPPATNKNGNMMMGHNYNVTGGNGITNNNFGGFGNTGGTTNMYGNGMGNTYQSGMMMSGFQQPAMLMGTTANATNTGMNMMNNNMGMISNNHHHIMMMNNGFQSNSNQLNNGMTINGGGGSMGGNNSNSAKNISTNFGTSNTSTKQHDPFANLGL